jgi:hypothetical protein
MEIINETLTAEVKAEIENLVEMAKSNECCMITSHRYAVQKGMVFDNKKGWLPINVTRYIVNYGSGIVSVQDVIDGCAMYDKHDIEEAYLKPVSEREIAKYGKITKFVIDYKNVRRIYSAE